MKEKKETQHKIQINILLKLQPDPACRATGGSSLAQTLAPPSPYRCFTTLWGMESGVRLIITSLPSLWTFGELVRDNYIAHRFGNNFSRSQVSTMIHWIYEPWKEASSQWSQVIYIINIFSRCYKTHPISIPKYAFL